MVPHIGEYKSSISALICALTELCLSDSVSDSLNKFVLHPALLDCALQASIILMISASSTSFRPYMPFALQELEVFGDCAARMWAFIRYSNGSKPEDKVQKLDIDLCDANGKLCARLKEFSSRILQSRDTMPSVSTDQSLSAPTFQQVKSNLQPLTGTIMLLPVWDSIPLEKGQSIPSSSDHIVIVGGTPKHRRTIQQYCPEAQPLEIHAEDSIEAIVRTLENCNSIDHIIWIAPHDAAPLLTADAFIDEQNQGVLFCFRMIKALLSLDYGIKNIGWTLLTFNTVAVNQRDAVNSIHASLHGLTGSMAKEYPDWTIRLFDLEANSDLPFAEMLTMPADVGGNVFAWRNAQWHRQNLIPCKSPDEWPTVYKKRGVYVVIGGAGGIGEAWSDYMISTYQAQIVWIELREKDAAIQSKLKRLSASGPAPFYIQADATNYKSLPSLAANNRIS